MHILIVCTGNTCRSPLAEALMRRALAARGAGQVTVGSAGTGAMDGAPASEGSVLVAMEDGLDLTAHRARLLTPELARSADLVLTMSAQHRDRAVALGAGERAWVLGAFAGRDPASAEVPDPFGADLDSYREAYEMLEALTDAAVARVVAGRADEQH